MGCTCSAKTAAIGLKHYPPLADVTPVGGRSSQDTVVAPAGADDAEQQGTSGAPEKLPPRAVISDLHDMDVDNDDTPLLPDEEATPPTRAPA